MRKGSGPSQALLKSKKKKMDYELESMEEMGNPKSEMQYRQPPPGPAYITYDDLARYGRRAAIWMLSVAALRISPWVLNKFGVETVMYKDSDEY
eukprot:jgi/Bigna1/138970/aug1.47_g13678